ncbi:MAG TPA: tetratricopeptide repeat protein [bacterium]|nr:tetratricopeptide repeat protein [bacterium]
MIDGVEGVGKTRFIREISAEFRAAGWQVLQSRAPDPELHFGPFHPLVFPGSENRPASNRIGGKSSGETLPARLSPGHTARDIIDRVCNLAHQRRIVLILDDLHRSDLAGIEIFRQLIERMKSTPFLVIAGIRLTDVRSEVRHTLDDMIRNEAVSRFQLLPLDSNDIPELFASLLDDNDLPDEVIQTLSAVSDGIPGHAEEALRMMIHSGELTRSATGWTGSPVHTIKPATGEIQGRIRRTLKKIDPVTLDVLRFIAFYDYPVPEKTLIAEYPYLEDPAPPHADCVELGFIERRMTESGPVYRIPSMLMVETLRETASAQTATYFHKTVAFWLRRNFSNEETAAGHLIRSGLKQYVSKSCYAAALCCFQDGAIDRAEKLLMAAVSRLQPVEKTLAVKISYLQARIAIYRNRIDDIIRWARNGLDAIPQNLKDATLTRVRLMILLAEGFNRKADYPQAIHILNDAETLIGDDRYIERMEIFIRRAGSYIFQGDHARALADALNSMAISGGINPDNPEELRVLGNTLNVLAHLSFLSGNREKSLEYYHRAIETGQAMKNSHWLAAIHNNLGEMHLYTGDLNASVEHLQRAIEYYRSAGLILATASAEANLGGVYFKLGQTRTSQRHYETALTYYSESNRRALVFYTMTQLAQVYLYNWEFAEVQRRLDDLDTMRRDLSGSDHEMHYWFLRGLVAHRFGRLYEAARALQRAWIATRRLQQPSGIASILIARANVFLDLNDLERARRAIEKGLREASLTSDHSASIEGLLSKSRLHRYLGNTLDAENALTEANAVLGDRFDPRNRYKIMFQQIKVFLERESKDNLKTKITELREIASSFQDREFHADTEILSARCAAYLGNSDTALRMLEPIHAQVIESGYSWVDWRISRLKAHLLQDAGMPVTARMAFDRAVDRVHATADAIESPRWRTSFMNRKDIRKLLREQIDCVRRLKRATPDVAVPIAPYNHDEPRRPVDADLAAMGKTMQSILSSLDFDDVIPKISRAVREMARADNGMLLIRDTHGRLWVRSSDYDDPDSDSRLHETLAIQAGCVALDSRRIIISRDIAEDPRIIQSDRYRSTGTKSLVSVPMISKNRLIGAIYAGSREPGARAMLDNQSQLVFLAEITAMTLENIRLYTDLDAMFVGMVKSLAAAIDATDPYTRGHSQRVRDIALALGDAINLAPEQRRNLELAAFLHDIGKIGIPEEILTQPSALTPDQRRLMETHPEIGADIISPINQLKQVAKIILQHHEHYDGRGYPRHSVTDDITIEARILAIADAYDAITTSRPYRGRQTMEQALDEIHRHAGTQFDPRIVAALQTLADAGRIDAEEE